jgi:glutamate carboxypeptidase
VRSERHGAGAELCLENVSEWAAAQLPAFTKQLKALVDVNSGTENLSGVHSVQRSLADNFERLGLSVDFIPQTNRAPILRARTRAGAESTDRLVLVGHADTVFGPDSSFQKFSIDAQNPNIARGPGAYDMKSGLVVIEGALKALSLMGTLENTPLEVLINSAEEYPTLETCETMKSLMRGASAALIFEFGRESNAIIVERKGMARYEIAIQGKEAHAGNGFFEGKSAFVEMARVVLELSKLSNEQSGLTVNPGLGHCSNSLGVVAGSAKFGIEIRACTTTELDRARETVKSLGANGSPFAYTIREIEHTPPMEIVEGTGSLLQRYIEAGRYAGVPFTKNGRVGGTSDGNLATSLGIPTIDALGPRGGGAHTEGEFVILSSIAERLSALVHFLSLKS